MSAEDAGTLAWQYRYGGKALDTSGIDIPQEGTTPTCNTAYAAGDGWVLWRPTLTEDVVTGGTVELEDVTIPYALVLPANVTLELTGTNTVNGPISAAGDLTVVGPGSLNIVTDKLAGISATGSVTVESGTVDVNMNTAETNARGIYSQTSVTVNGGAVTVELQSSAANAYGVMAGTGVAVSGGTFDVTAKSTAAEGAILSGGLFTMGPTTFSGGNVTVSADSFAVCSMGAITLESGMRETGGNVVCSGTIEDTGAAAVYTFAAEGKTFTTNAEMKTVAAKSIELKQRGTLSVFTTDADAHYDVGDTITANIVVSALEDTGKTVNSANFTLDYDKTNLTLNEITVADGWTTDTVDGATRMIETTSEGKSVPEGGLVIAAATFTVNAGAADNTSTAITVTDPELKITGENNGFVPAVVPAPVALHNIIVTLVPTAGAALTDSTHTQGTDPINAYAKYGAAGLYSDTGRTTTFTMPTVTATTGYRLAKDGEPRWTMIMVPYYSDEAVMDAVYTVSTTLTVYVVKTYNVTVTATAGGSLSSDESLLILDLGSGLLDQLPTATADSNHTFAGWYIKAANETDTDTLIGDTTGVYSDMTVEARFTAKSYTWTAPTGDNFTYTVSDGVSDDNQISYGTPIHFTLTAAEGYVIDTVSYQVGTANAVTITPTGGTYTIPGDQITGNVTVTVTTAELCTITFADTTGATLSDTPTYYGKVGKTGLYSDKACTNRITELPTITYASGDGWQYFAYSSNIWSYSGASSSMCNSSDLLGNSAYEWWVNTGNITVTPNVVKKYLITLKVDDSSHATITAYRPASSSTTSWAQEDNPLVNMGEPTITYAPGYVFKSFTFDGVEYTTWTNGYWMDSVHVTKAATLTLNTQPGTYAVTFPETITGATISDKIGLNTETGEATFNQNVTFKVTATEGYTVDSVTYTVGSGDAVAITPDAESVYTIPGGKITDTVTVTIESTRLHKVTFATTAETPHGSLTGTTTLYLADAATLTAEQLTSVGVTPDVGYELKNWVDAGGNTVNDPTSVPITADTSFTAVFGLADYTMTVPTDMTAVVDSKTYEAGTAVTVHYGTDIVLAPNSTATIVSVSYQAGSGETQAITLKNGSYTILGTAVTGDLTVTAATLADKGFALSYISAEQYMALSAGTMIAVLTPVADDANGAAVKSITTSGGDAFYWSDRYDAFVKIVASTETAEAICGGLTFSSTGTKNAIAYTGDINGDGKISAADAAVANEILHNPNRAGTTELMRLMCDVTDNNTTGAKIVTSDDILWILKRPGVIA